MSDEVHVSILHCLCPVWLLAVTEWSQEEVTGKWRWSRTQIQGLVAEGILELLYLKYIRFIKKGVFDSILLNMMVVLYTLVYPPMKRANKNRAFRVQIASLLSVHNP